MRSNLKKHLARNGVAIIKEGEDGMACRVHNLNIIASWGGGWDHVSVSLASSRSCPYWEEMKFVKDLFWGPDEVVMQLHPKEADYVNNHPGCLHLWRPFGQEIPTPPAWMVGVPATKATPEWLLPAREVE